jgi:hypothetical protein
MGGSWERLAHVELGSDGATLDSGTFTAKKNLKVIMSYSGATNGSADAILRVGNGTVDSDYNYSDRKSLNGGSDSTTVSQSSFYNSFCWAGYAGVDKWHFTTIDISNIADKEKLAFGYCIRTGDGAGNLPSRVEVVGKWANSSVQINRIVLTGSGGSSNQNYASGSYITVWGASEDVVNDTTQNSTFFSESDTGKDYIWNGSEWTEVE